MKKNITQRVSVRKGWVHVLTVRIWYNILSLLNFLFLEAVAKERQRVYNVPHHPRTNLPTASTSTTSTRLSHLSSRDFNSTSNSDTYELNTNRHTPTRTVRETMERNEKMDWIRGERKLALILQHWQDIFRGLPTREGKVKKASVFGK